MRWLAAILTLFLALAAPRSAFAYFVGTCNSAPVERSNLIPQFRANAFAGADPVGQFDQAIAIFNRNPTNMHYWSVIDFDTNYVVAMNNGHTEVWPTIDPDLFNGDSFAAVGFYWLDGCTIDEGDVIFNLAFDWNTASVKTDYNAYGDSSSDLSTIPAAVHELGHTVGFGHDCSTYNVMGDGYHHFWANGADAGAYLGEGVIDGLIAIYGDTFPPTLQSPDVAVTHWQYASCNNPYSVHKRTAISDVSGAELPMVPGETEPRFIAAAGQTVEATFTYENLGNTLQEGVNIGFYYSSDDTITTLDRRIGGTTLDFVRNNPDTRRISVDLPIDLPQGDGYLGVIVDEHNDIAEGFEQNNASYIGIRIDGVDRNGDGKPDNGSETFYQYAAKVVCGRQDAEDDLRLRPGIYATTVNVLNPGSETVRFQKRLAVSFPPKSQRQGKTYDFGFDSLDPLRALKTDCDDLTGKAFGGTPPEPYYEGFVVITSPKSLDVTAVYTSSLPHEAGLAGGGEGNSIIDNACQKRRHCGCCCCEGGGDSTPGDGHGTGAITMDVEQIRERILKPKEPPHGGETKPDLIPVPGRATNPLQPLTKFCRLENGKLMVRVRNQGEAQAHTSVTSVTYAFDNQPILRVTAPLDSFDKPNHDIDVPFPFPRACFANQVNCPFTVMVDSGGNNDESDETNNQVDGLCIAPAG